MTIHPSIVVGIDATKQRPFVQVRDTELFDFIEDFLIEEHDIEYLWLEETSEANEALYTMFFDVGLFAEIQAALSLLEKETVEQILQRPPLSQQGKSVKKT